jgi:hypothetical protein
VPTRLELGAVVDPPPAPKATRDEPVATTTAGR